MTGRRLGVYRTVTRQPGVRRLIFTVSISRMTIPLLTLPILIGVGTTYADPNLGAAMVAVCTAAFACTTILTGRLIDRIGARTVLRVWLAIALASIAAVAFELTTHAPIPVLATTVCAVGVGLPPVGAVTRTAWPQLVPSTALRAAYSLDAATTDAATVIGPLLASAALTLTSPAAALLLPATAITIGALGLPGLALDRRHQPPKGPRQNRPAKTTLLVLTTATFASVTAGSMVAAAGILTITTGSEHTTGVLLAVLAAGAVSASLLTGRSTINPSRIPHRLIAYSLITAIVILGLQAAAVLDSLSLATLIGGYLASGCLTGPRDALVQLALAEVAAPRHHAAAFSWLLTADLLGFSIGAAAASTTNHPFLVGAAAALLSLVPAGLLAATLHPQRQT